MIPVLDVAFHLYFNRRMVIIGLGSNVGERDAMLSAAVGELGRLLGNIRESKRIETPALLLPNSPPEWDIPFLNMAVAGDCVLAPQALLIELKAIEQKLGRQDRGRWAPREIDLDILAIDDLEIHEVNLIVPHPELLSRYFALAPLVDVAPEMVIAGKAAREWLAEL